MDLSDIPQPGRAPHELTGDHRDVQYGGAILKDTQGQFFATRPVKGRSASVS